MSREGIKVAARVFEYMQNARIALMQMATRDTIGGRPMNESNKQDLLLSKLMERGNEAIKDEFARIVAMKTGEK